MPKDSEQLQLDFKIYASEAMQAKARRDRLLEQARQVRRATEQKYSPRARFERWRDSKDGKQWKQKQHRKQKGCCASCQIPIALSGSHIDHIQPLSREPKLACEPRNLQILCASCNQRKGVRDSSE